VGGLQYLASCPIFISWSAAWLCAVQAGFGTVSAALETFDPLIKGAEAA
jgi:hypothetical protein